MLKNHPLMRLRLLQKKQCKVQKVNSVLTGNFIANKIKKVSTNSTQSISETVECEILKKDICLQKKTFMDDIGLI